MEVPVSLITLVFSTGAYKCRSGCADACLGRHASGGDGS